MERKLQAKNPISNSMLKHVVRIVRRLREGVLLENTFSFHLHGSIRFPERIVLLLPQLHNLLLLLHLMLLLLKLMLLVHSKVGKVLSLRVE